MQKARSLIPNIGWCLRKRGMPSAIKKRGMPSAIKKRGIPTAIKKTANLVRQPAHRATRVRPGERSNNGVGSGEQVNSGTKNGESGEHHNRVGAAGAKIWTSATSSCAGTSRLSALAVCMLMTNSNLVDCTATQFLDARGLPLGERPRSPNSGAGHGDQ